MTGKTHRVGGMLCCFVGYSVLKNKGLLTDEVNPLLQVTIMYPFAIYGSILPDLDHNADSIPSKDIISVVINKILHLTTSARKAKDKITGKDSKQKPFNPKDIFDARHRSWQTHSDVFLAIFLTLYYKIVNGLNQSMDTILLSIVLLGLTLGIISHMILDMLTPEGIWSIITVSINKIISLFKGNKNSKSILPEKIKFVPNSSFFATDGSWEKIIRFLLWGLNFIYLLKIIYDVSPYQISFNFM